MVIPHNLPCDLELTRVCFNHSSDDFCERRLSRAILSNQRMDLARGKLKRNALKSKHTRKVFRDSGCLEKRAWRDLHQRGVAVRRLTLRKTVPFCQRFPL